MKQWTIRFLLLAVVLGVGYWLWTVFFPNTEQIIRQRLAEAAQLASFKPTEGELARLSNSKMLADFFTSDTAILVDIPGEANFRLRGRQDLFQAILGARSMASGLQVELLDITVQVAPDKTSANIETTGKVTVPGRKDFSVQELRFEFQKLDGDWLIRRVETVKTLR